MCSSGEPRVRDSCDILIIDATNRMLLPIESQPEQLAFGNTQIPFSGPNQEGIGATAPS